MRFLRKMGSSSDTGRLCIRLPGSVQLGSITAKRRGGTTRCRAPQGRGAPVGLVGMCFSGGFALAAAVEPCIAASVSCQPALPVPPSPSIDVSREDQRALRARLDAGELRIRAYRFDDDASSPCSRMLRLGALLGEGFDARCLSSAAAKPTTRTPSPCHNVLTHHFSDQAGSLERNADFARRSTATPWPRTYCANGKPPTPKGAAASVGRPRKCW